MALIVLASASGSPGVTTAALGLAMTWTRPAVLVDADPTGASAIPAGYFRGGQLPTDATLLDLALAHRQGTLVDDLPHMLSRIPGTHVDFLRGPLAHTQARGLGGLWEPLAGVLRALERNGQDVIVDAGRLGLEGSPLPLLFAADVAILVTRSHLPAVVAAKSWSDTLREEFERIGASANLAALVVGPSMPYGTAEVAKVLQLPVSCSLAWDPPSAEVFSRGAQPPRKFTNGALSRSLHAAVQAIQSTVTRNRANLGLDLAQRSQG